MAVINMQLMRYINLLDKVSHVKTMKCYLYNNSIIFAVPRKMISRAIGIDARNIMRISQQIGKKVKIIEEASGLQNAEKFVSNIVSPLSFNSINIENGILTLNAGMQSKAALIGRMRRREQELQKIIKDVFNLELKIA